MIEQIGVALPTQAYFSTLGVGTESLIVTVDVRRNGVLIVTGASVPEIGGGFYGYSLDASYNTVEGIYTFLFKTTTVTVDQQQLVGAWYVGKAGVENLDAAITTRLAPTVTGRTLDVSATGEAGLDWSNIGSPNAEQSLSLTNIYDALHISSYLSTSIAKTNEVATAAQIDAQLSGTHGAGTWGAGGGSGAISKTVTITVSGLPRDGVEVWVTTDEAGVNVVASGVTDAFGNVAFMLDAGSYWCWKQLADVNFVNPQVLAVP